MADNRVNEIDLLRFVAAVAVVLFHYAFRGHLGDELTVLQYPLLAPVAKYGYLGVELFFLISGFVILMTAAKGSLRSFAVSRIVRLYPAFWVCCTATFLAALVIGGGHFNATWGEYLVNMTMLSEFGGVPAIDGVYWSLFVEMRFYALVAVVLAIGKICNAQSLLVGWLVVSAFLTFLPIRGLRGLFIVDYSPFFIGGALCFLIWSQGVSWTRIGGLLASWGLALGQSLGRLPVVEELYGTPMNYGVAAGLVTAFFVVMFLIATRRTGVVGRRRWLLAGALTYPLYLLHQNIGYMIFNIAYPRVNVHVLLWGTLFLMLVASYAVNRFVERRYAAPMKSLLNKLLDSLPQVSMRFWLRGAVGTLSGLVARRSEE